MRPLPQFHCRTTERLRCRSGRPAAHLKMLQHQPFFEDVTIRSDHGLLRNVARDCGAEPPHALSTQVFARSCVINGARETACELLVDR